MKELNPTRIASVVLVTLALMSAAGQLSIAQKKGDPAVPSNPAPPFVNGQPRPATNSPDGTAANQAFELELLLSGKSQITDIEENRRQLAAQLGLDFQRLEQLNNEQIAPLLRAGAVDGKLDYKRLSRAAIEIKDRATRIKYYIPLSLRFKRDKIRHNTHDDKLDSMLPELSGVIKSFISNPVFHEHDRNDAELRSNAGHDLEGIIKLSETINKIARRLAKASTRHA
jgi:hypothetical protein